MISNFNEVEKSLKRCLKEKVSITTATVVGFLIAGTVAFGAEATKEYTTESFTKAIEEVVRANEGLSINEDKNFNGVEYVYEGPDTIKRLITVTKGTTTLDDKTNISTEKNVVLLNAYEANAINNGILENKSKEGGQATVGVNAKKMDASFINNGTVTRTGKASNNYAIDLSSGEGQTATLTNTGTITGMIKSDPNVAGNVVINLENKSDIDGEFIFWGKGKRTINKKCIVQWKHYTFQKFLFR